jgi:hypothetical protein
MKFSKLKSTYQTSLSSRSQRGQSLFSFKKESILINNRSQLFLASSNFLCRFVEYLIFRWEKLLLSLKRSYLFEIIRFKELSNSFTQNKIALPRIKTNRSNLLFFFNIPFNLSLIISEIFVSITKKTIYLYRLFIFLSLPFLIFLINQTFVVKDQKDYLPSLLQYNKKACFSKQEGKTKKKNLSLISLRESGFNSDNIRLLFKNLKDSALVKQDSSWFCNEKRSYLASFHMSYLTFFFNIYKEKSLCIPLPLRASFCQKMNKIFISGQFLILKNPKFDKISNYRLGHTHKKEFMFSKWFFSFIELKKHNLVHFFLGNSLKQRDYILEENKKEKRFLQRSQPSFHSIDFFRFVRFFYFWTLRDNSKNFAKLKFFQKVDSPFFSLIQPKHFNWLNNFPVIVLSREESFLFLKKQQPFVFRYYQNALKSHFITSEGYSSCDNLLFALRNRSYSLETCPIFLKKIKSINNLYSNLSSKTFFGNSEFFHFVSNRAKIISEISERKKNNHVLKTNESTYLQSVDFYLKKKKAQR